MMLIICLTMDVINVRFNVLMDALFVMVIIVNSAMSLVGNLKMVFAILNVVTDI